MPLPKIDTLVCHVPVWTPTETYYSGEHPHHGRRLNQNCDVIPVTNGDPHRNTDRNFAILTARLNSVILALQTAGIVQA